mgnify:FL=1
MLKQIIKSVLLWRLAILAVAAMAVYILPAKDCCQDFGANLSPSYLANIWANFAGGNFLDLARLGHGLPLKSSTYVFFPLFPAAINILTTVIPNYLASGLVLVHVSLVLALYYLSRLVRLDYKKNIAQNTLLLLLLFPTAFFFGSVYTESFFLLLVVLSFYLVRKKQFLLACLTGLFASATSFAGIFLWPALIWEIWQSRDRTSLIWLLLPPLGLLTYMKFLVTKTGDAFYFLKVTPDFGPNLVINKLILLHQVFFRYGKMLVASQWANPLFFTIVLEFTVGILFLILTILAFKKLRHSYAIFTLLSYLIPTFTGTFTGLPRYALTIFPAFILLSLWYDNQKPLVKKVYLAINIATAVFLVTLFTRGYFVG